MNEVATQYQIAAGVLQQALPILAMIFRSGAFWGGHAFTLFILKSYGLERSPESSLPT